jgi:hypothetical protein
MTGLHLYEELGGSLTAQCDFGAIHAKHSRIAAGSTTSRRDAHPGKETQFHETRRKIGRQIDVLEDGGFSFAEICEAAETRGRDSCWRSRGCRGTLVDTELHFHFSMLRGNRHVKGRAGPRRFSWL